MKDEPDMKVYHAANLEVQEAKTSKRTGGSTVYTKKKKMKGDPKGNMNPGAVNNNALECKSKETLAMVGMRPLVSALSSTVILHISNNATSVIAPNRLKESVGPSAPELVRPTSTEATVQCNTISTTSEPVLPKEDDLDTLINEFLEGIPEEELQVDPNKSTDDLIRELYEYMDTL
ncbi:zinc finger CCCH domain-containing protein 11A-like [Discoglossus pictus]